VGIQWLSDLSLSDCSTAKAVLGNWAFFSPFSGGLKWRLATPMTRAGHASVDEGLKVFIQISPSMCVVFFVVCKTV